MEIINNIDELPGNQEVLIKALYSGTNLEGRSRYYLMQLEHHPDECDRIDKRLLKFFGFSSKADFRFWRDALSHNGNRLVEWTAGFLFKFYGDDRHYTLVDKNGKEPKKVH